jgi:hypothetical protein
MMLKFTTTLGINPPILGNRDPLITPLRLYQKPQIHEVQHNQVLPLNLQVPLTQTSRLLATNSTDRLHHSNKQSEIGWNSWQPIDRFPDHDDFDYKVDRSRYSLADRSSHTDELENPESDFFTTVLPTEFAEIDPQLDSLPTNSIDVEIPTPTNKDRYTPDLQLQSPEKIKPKSVELDRKLSDSNQIDRLEQPKSEVQIPQVSANIQLPPTPQIAPKIVGENTTVPGAESLIGLLLDNLALNAFDGSFSEPPPETIINLNADSTQSTDPVTQVSRSIVGKASPQENQIASNLADPNELIPDPIVPNLLDAPTTVNPATIPKIASLEPELTTTIIPESAIPPENITPFTVLEQIATAVEIAPISESSDRLRADQIAPNPLDLSPVVDPQTTTPLPRLEQRSTATENTSVMPLAVELVRESSSDTLPVDRSDSPIINQPPFTDTAQISTSLDELAIANLDIPALTSLFPSEDLSSTTSPLLTDPAQIATVPNQVTPEIQSTQPLNPATTQLNLAADLSNIDRDLDPSVQLEPTNLNIPESPDTLTADSPLTNLLPAPNPAQIATSPTPIEIEADLQSTQLVNADTSQINSLNPVTINQSTTENLEISPIPIVESFDTLSVSSLSLAESPLPWRIDPDLITESSPTSNIDRSLQDSPLIASIEVISVDRESQENITESGEEVHSDNLLISPLTDRSIINQKNIDLSQDTNQIEHFQIDTVDKPDDIAHPINNSIDNLTSAIPVDSLTTALPIIGQEELSSTLIDNSIDLNADNSADTNIPTPTVGYATGGYVKDANHIDLQSIASSDTVSAMLTPGEFVINAKDAQKNLNLLTHINRGGEPEAAIPSTEIQPSIIESPPTSTDISPTSIQRKRNDSLISPSLQREISLQQLSSLINPGLDTFESSQIESSNSSPIYSSPSMIFRKPMSSPQPQYTGVDTPDQWGSIEDLMSGGSHNSDTFSFENTSPQQPDLESRSSPNISHQDATPIRGFADGGEVTPSDISTTIEPITQTIESPIDNPQPQPENNDPAELEILAREIYHRLRQRLEIERERHGSYSGNLAW